jgi:hypothetical protein
MFVSQPLQHEGFHCVHAPRLMFKCCRRRRTASTLRKWTALLRHVLRVRRLQRVFAYIGHVLQEKYPPRLRERLRVVFPTGRQAQLLR